MNGPLGPMIVPMVESGALTTSVIWKGLEYEARIGSDLTYVWAKRRGDVLSCCLNRSVGIALNMERGSAGGPLT